VSALVEAWRFRQYRRFDDDAWWRTLVDSIDGRAGVPMPGFPSDEIQADFVGTANETAMREAWNFYVLMSDTRRRYGLTLGRSTNVLDFGCGWGRFARMFLRDVPPRNLWCADSWDLALETCRRTGVPGRLVKVDQLPPASLPSDHFDTAFAYSVFSHLSPAAHRAWEAEFGRMVRSGGLVFVTTQPVWFFDNCQHLRDNPDQILSGWHESLAKSFLDHDDAVRRYEAGEFMFSATGGGPSLKPEYYGEAVVPRAFFEHEWGEHFELLEFITERSRFEQAVAILRRR
jgi:hypothetical protein